MAGRSMVGTIALMVALLMCGASAQRTVPSVVSVAQSSGATAFVQAVQAANLTAVLSGFKGTVFVPTDTAFLASLGTLLSTSGCGQTDVLRSILLFHVVPGAARTLDSLSNEQVLSTALSGQTLRMQVTCERNCLIFNFFCTTTCDRKVKGAGNSIATIEDEARVGTSASLLFISAVLLPALVSDPSPPPSPSPRPPAPSPSPSPPPPAIVYRSILDAIVKAPALQSYASLSRLLALAPANLIPQELTSGSIAITLFLPTYTALRAAVAQAAGVADTDVGLIALAFNPGAAATEAVGRLLSYHVSQSVLRAVDLTNGRQVMTLFQNRTLTTQLTSGQVRLAAGANTATVLAADIIAGQAVIHLIDRVLLAGNHTSM